MSRFGPLPNRCAAFIVRPPSSRRLRRPGVRGRGVAVRSRSHPRGRAAAGRSRPAAWGDALSCQRDRGAVFIDKRHWDSPERQRQAMRQKDHFGVKGEAVDRGSRKNLSRGAAAENLQPALSVGHLPRYELSDNTTEHPRGERAQATAGGRTADSCRSRAPKTTSHSCEAIASYAVRTPSRS